MQTIKADHSDLDDFRFSLVERAFIGSVWFATEVRSAWHGYESKRYLVESISLARDFARVVAERNRKRGSHWIVKEHPCLVLETSERTVVALEIGASGGWERWPKPFSSLFLDDVLRAFSNRDSPNRHLFETGGLSVPSWEEPGEVEVSRTSDSPGPLEWRSSHANSLRTASLHDLFGLVRDVSVRFPFTGLALTTGRFWFEPRRVRYVHRDSPFSGVRPGDRLVKVKNLNYGHDVPVAPYPYDDGIPVSIDDLVELQVQRGGEIVRIQADGPLSPHGPVTD